MASLDQFLADLDDLNLPRISRARVMASALKVMDRFHSGRVHCFTINANIGCSN